MENMTEESDSTHLTLSEVYENNTFGAFPLILVKRAFAPKCIRETPILLASNNFDSTEL